MSDIGGENMPSKEDIDKAQKEYEELMQWERAENKKIIANIKATGESIGLDTHRDWFRPTIEERNRRLKEIRLKYHLDEEKNDG